MTLNPRQGNILKAIVNDYVETSDPIGSEWLATHYDFGCKSATLRNEMAEMSDLGYLVQPHTSAGRIPSDRGYRYYVDRLMPPPTISAAKETRKLSALSATSAVEEIVQQTCRILSGMTQYPSVASPPSAQSTMLRRLYVTSASTQHALIVLLLSTGHVENRIVDLGSGAADRSLECAANYLNANLSGLEITAIPQKKLSPIPNQIAGLGLVETIHAAVVEAVRSLGENRLFLEGTSQFLRHREFQDVARLETLLSALDQRSVLFQVLGRALLGQDVCVVIGAEGAVRAMRECSVVSSQYRIGDRIGGFIGVVGPTRMDYNRAVGAVGLMASSLSAVLTQHSLE